MKHSLLFFAVLFLVSCATEEPLKPGERRILLRSASRSASFVVEIADEPREHAVGLMSRTVLPPGHGMLFLFPDEQELRFWMKNTLIPLDIFYFDSRGHLVSATTMEPCEADPCPSYRSEGPAKFALEVAAGFLKDEPGPWELLLP